MSVDRMLIIPRTISFEGYSGRAAGPAGASCLCLDTMIRKPESFL
jgi:hypothetical protein